MELRVTNITVTTGVNAIITVEPFSARDYAFYKMVIGQSLPANVGTEQVIISNGTDTFPLIDNAGNLVVIGKMRGLRKGRCEVRVSKYRLQFGANGMPAAIPHFVVKEGLCPLKYNGTAGAFDDDEL